MVNPSKLSLKHATVIVVVFRDRSFSVGGISGGGGGGGDMEKGRTKESLQGEVVREQKPKNKSFVQPSPQKMFDA